MLTDTKLKNLKAREKLYKVADRDGLYVTVSPKGLVTFRYDYRINGRRETLTIGRYGDGISLAQAREKLVEAKKRVNAGISPAGEKRDGKTKRKEEKTLHDFTVSYMKHTRLADSTRAMKQSIIDRDITPVWGRKLLSEITPSLLREYCDKIKARGAPATAIQVRNIVSAVFKFAALHGDYYPNPAEEVLPASIATFEARDRALKPEEIGWFFNQLEQTGALPTIKLAIKLVLLTMVRKGELLNAPWSEINFNACLWTIDASRMKGSRDHNVYLSRQAQDILIALKMCAGSSDWVLPSCNQSSHKTMSAATLNRVINLTVKQAQERGIRLASFSVHDMRRTASTLLHEAGFNSDWIEKCLAHEERSVRAVYNKAEYAEQRRDMLQQWADMVDGWIKQYRP
ncbi:tyrosine-type recombinase/integrase [Escherichia coli]|nr:tyrosine-type recombinase/integrase [Escherichia coli]EFH6067419.1 tyrosine-type recombinase/integrase [Escherichia coli]EFN3806821.1 tyrosine-type recombinase/integrase [Escherichia coli]EFN4947061.1 tyrosine-type recombinase/integrase [Escherichia coli]EFN5638243.1 tyrosine-type recombinase/integrase [Escherichia coli]